MTIDSDHPETAIFWKRVRDFTSDSPVILRPDDNCAQVIEAMCRNKATAAVIIDENSAVKGIVTEQDVVRRLAYRVAQNAPISDIMTRPVRTVSADDYLYHAIAAMQRHRLRHIPVLGPGNKVTGMLRLADALGAVSPQRLDHLDLLAQENTPDGLREIKAVQIKISRDLFQTNVQAPHILSVLTHINAGIYRALIGTAIEAMAKQGLGPPPVGFAVIVMGSGGRRESYLHPDQDNGFIIEDYRDEDHQRIDGWFLDLADRLTQGLDDAGIPLCNGYVMAVNPIWRKTLSQWKAQTTGWIRKQTPMAIRFADIFFDFDWVYGDRTLVEKLRRHITRTTKNAHGFLRQLYHDDANAGVALGWFGRIKTIRNDREHKGQIAMKHSGLLPLIQAVRLLALRAGIGQTPTLARIDKLRIRNVLGGDEADDLQAAFHQISHLLLRHQLEQAEAGGPIDNYVTPDKLTRRERRLLASSFKAINGLLDKVKYEISGDVF